MADRRRAAANEESAKVAYRLRTGAMTSAKCDTWRSRPLVCRREFEIVAFVSFDGVRPKDRRTEFRGPPFTEFRGLFGLFVFTEFRALGIERMGRGCRGRPSAVD